MAKKRVHEIAKERGISSKEVLAVLQKAGLDVKAAASSVDEDDIRRAFSNGAEAAQPATSGAPAADGDGAQVPAAETRQAPRREAPAEEQRQPQQQRPPQQPSQQGDGGQRPQRPQSRSDQPSGGGGGGRRRRVVND
jgi:translation initiation factor IF-2